MKSEFEIAKIVKPRGLKGEMKAEFFSSDTARLSHLKKVRVGDDFRDVEKISAEGRYGFIKLSGVDSVEEAEELRGALIYAKRSELPPLADGKHYIADIIGLAVIVAGERIGVITDVAQYGSADVYSVRTSDGTLSFPALKQLIKEVDIEGGKMVLDDILFRRVVVYN